jgi:hypothetical protein
MSDRNRFNNPNMRFRERSALARINRYLSRWVLRTQSRPSVRMSMEDSNERAVLLGPRQFGGHYLLDYEMQHMIHPTNLYEVAYGVDIPPDQQRWGRAYRRQQGYIYPWFLVPRRYIEIVLNLIGVGVRGTFGNLPRIAE